MRRVDGHADALAQLALHHAGQCLELLQQGCIPQRSLSLTGCLTFIHLAGHLSKEVSISWFAAEDILRMSMRLERSAAFSTAVCR